MRKIILLLSVLALVACSQSPQKKAESLVKSYLKENLHNPKSYEAVEFSKIDSFYVQHTADEVCPDAVAFNQKADEFDKIREKYFAELEVQSDTITDEYRQSDEFQNKIANAKTYLLGLIDSAKVYNDKAALAQLKFGMRGKFGGYKIEHKYRASNKMGATVLDTDVFYLDSILSKVINVEEKQ